MTYKEFISKLKEPFEPLYFDSYLATSVVFADDDRLSTFWFAKIVNEEKKYYAKKIKDEEHIFIVKKSKSKIYRNPITKNFFNVLSGGFILTDKFLYTDENVYNHPIPIMNIKRFETRYLSSKNEYLLSVVYYEEYTMRERYLLRLDARAFLLCERLNLFISVYRKKVTMLKNEQQ